MHEVIRRDRDVRTIDNFHLIQNLTPKQKIERNKLLWKKIMIKMKE